MPSKKSKNIPLAERMRPTRIEDFVGQEELLGEDRILKKLFLQKIFVNSLFPFSRLLKI
ncbi:hypothetical protein ACFLZ5_10595 [Thermodesulfobacteriota bacterium]